MEPSGEALEITERDDDGPPFVEGDPRRLEDDSGSEAMRAGEPEEAALGARLAPAADADTVGCRAGKIG